MKKILITGVAGFIGSHVASRFLAEGYSVVGVDDLSSGRIANVPAGIEFIKGDLSKVSTINKIPSDCFQILHLAGQSSGEISFVDPVADLQKNTISTLNLIHYGIECQVERMIYASSMSVYGSVTDAPINEMVSCNPLSCYGISKYASEQYLSLYMNKLPSVSLRMFNVYGPGQDMSNLRQGMVSIYLAQALSNKKIEVKGSDQRFRDFIFIDDVVEAWYRASIFECALGKKINVGTGIRTTVKELINIISQNLEGCEYYTNGSTLGDQNGIYSDTKCLNEILQLNEFTPLSEGVHKFVNSCCSISNIA